MTRARLICTVTVVDRQARVHAVPFSGRHTVTFHHSGKPDPTTKPAGFDTKAEALVAARAYAWIGLEPIRARLHEFAQQHGRAWKSHLAALWASGGDAADPQLRYARNVLGPEWLKQAHAADLADA